MTQHKFKKILVLIASLTLSASADSSTRVYELWEPEQAPNNSSGDLSISKEKGVPFDKDWEEWSYPIGNGYMGANLFGRVDTERIQITEKTLLNEGIYNRGGLTSFAEVFLDFNHQNISNYRRSLNLNEAIAYVSYEQDGVEHTREYFMSYPDNVLVIKISANKKGAVSFTLRPEIPYLDQKGGRTATILATEDLITLSGTLPYFNLNYEAQIKVLHDGGVITVDNQNSGKIKISKANSVTLILATGTNYELCPDLFIKPNAEKLDPQQFPHEKVSALIDLATDKTFDGLKKSHLLDYQNLFSRVALNLNSTPSALPTHQLLSNYKAGEKDTYLEELMFQYARYLLIASSREKTLPATLQGVWSQFYNTPWTGGYWHNINVQMNYWGAFSANLAETFEAYLNYFNAYLPKATEHATQYVKQHNPDRLSNEPGENGWIIGTGANAFYLPSAGGGHSGPGTGGFTTKLLMEYYLFTQNEAFLSDIGYPALLSMSKFFSKALKPEPDGTLLVYPSASPEQKVKQKEQLEGMPGHLVEKGYYITTGCTFDQSFVWENYNDTLIAAKVLGKDDAFLQTIHQEIDHLDPILIGASGQIKEYREEVFYSDIGDPKHRHISHLCGLYPGTLINFDRPEWMQAAEKTLDFRGNKTTGWAMAHRMNCRARLKEGEKAHELYQTFITERTVPNLWTLHPPFQIDGSLGTMAGVAEMLLQSHEEYIVPLPALPNAWSNGSYEGLVARGNFVFSAIWENGKAQSFAITARKGGECRIQYPLIGTVQIKDRAGQVIAPTRSQNNKITFPTIQGETYTIAF